MVKGRNHQCGTVAFYINPKLGRWPHSRLHDQYPYKWMNWVEHCFKLEHYCLTWGKMVWFGGGTFTHSKHGTVAHSVAESFVCLNSRWKWKKTQPSSKAGINFKNFGPLAKQFLNMLATGLMRILTQTRATNSHNQNGNYIIKVFAPVVIIGPQTPEDSCW